MTVRLNRIHGKRKPCAHFSFVRVAMISLTVVSLRYGLKRRMVTLVSSNNDSANLLGTFAKRYSQSASCTGSDESPCDMGVKTLHRRAIHVVHRHGDRTPITPLKDEGFWLEQLVSDATLKKIASNTKLIKPNSANTHNANGRGPFGKLTDLGLLQLVELGSSLRERFSGDNTSTVDSFGRTLYPHIWTPEKPLSPSNIRIMSTNFLRTIQSVQGLLVGLFPDGTSDLTIPIDVRHTDWMIPDPQPRRTNEQAELEEELSVRPHILAKEIELLPLAIKATYALHQMLAPDAREADFGVPQKTSEMSIEIQPLSWNQLAEITKCLAVRKLLPEGITKEDQEAIIQHAAWRWFESFRNPRLAHLAMGTMVQTMINSMQKLHHRSVSEEPPMTVWSAHDSTLICLMCAFNLEQPAVWPEYGSYLMVELIEVDDEDDFFVRFSLNGQVLKSQWNNELREMIPLSKLAENIKSQSTGVETSS